MNKNHKYIITNERKGQIIFVLVIILAIVIGLVWNYIEAENNAPKWPGDVKSHPMANAHISWEQTHYPGPWGGVNDGH